MGGTAGVGEEKSSQGKSGGIWHPRPVAGTRWGRWLAGGNPALLDWPAAGRCGGG